MTKQETVMFGKASVLLVLGLMLGACGDTHSMKSQGQTHWLVQCDSNADCGELSCECGVCVAPCDSAGECSVEGVETQCFQRGSGAVRALCGQEHEVPLCLESCDDDCSGGQSCQANACLPSRSPGADASMETGVDGPDASVIIGHDGGAVGPDGGVVGPDASGPALPGIDAGSIPEAPTGSFTLGVRNERRSAVVLFVAGCNGDQHWFDVSEGGEQLAITMSATCDCRGPDYEELGCSYRPAVCGESVFETLEPGAEKTYTWDTGHWFPRVNTECSYRWPLTQGTEIMFRACWLDEIPATGSLQYPDDFSCTARWFTIDSRTGSEWLTILDIMPAGLP